MTENQLWRKGGQKAEEENRMRMLENELFEEILLVFFFGINMLSLMWILKLFQYKIT
jgi:hypothetical protein